MTNTMQKRNGPNSNEFGYVVENMLNNTLRRFFDGNAWDAEGQNNLSRVPVNVRETDQQYELDVISPGCRREDFKVRVQNNELQISMTRNENKKQNDEQDGWVRNEYIQRSFSRHFTLDETVNVTNMTATYTDGILHIVLPKTEKAKPRLLSVDVQ